MPARSVVSQLPDALKVELDRRLLQSGFSGYRDLAKWLADNGFEISKSALGRYGQKFEERVRALKLATEQARALAEAAPDDEGALSDSLIRLVQEKLFTILMDLEVESIDKINVGSLTKGIATLARATVKQKEWQSQVRSRAQQVADEVADAARDIGASDEAVATWRKRIIGIAG